MSATEVSERRASLQSRLLERLHNPTQLRIILTAAVLAIGYWAIAKPLSERIAATTRKLDESRRQLDLAREVEQLRDRFGDVQKRLPRQTDAKEWVRYVLGGIRQFPLKLNSLNCDPPRELGPYKAVVLQVQVTGSFADLSRFLHWLELNERFFRVDRLSIASGTDKTGSGLVMQLTVLGMMG